MIGIGTDIIEIVRIKKAAQNERFLQRYFTKEELLFLKEKKAESIAGNFAAKEAVAKAFGTGFRGFGPKDIAILRDKNGCPFVALSNKAQEIAKQQGIEKIHISISHNKENAIAFAVAQGGTFL